MQPPDTFFLCRKKHAEALIIKKKRTYASHRSPQKAKEYVAC